MITDQEWNSIREYVERISRNISGRRSEFFLVSKVLKNDETNNLVWVKELEDTPIPIFAFDYEVKYYDESPRGTGWGWGVFKTYTKYAKVRVLCPKVGDYVIVAREMGSDRLPRCLGVLKSTNFVIDEGD